MANSKIDFAKLETILENPNAKSSDLLTLIRGIPALKQFKPVRGFPQGTPDPFVVRSRYELEPDVARKLNEGLMGNTDPAIRTWRVFPFGIVNPERYVVEVDVGRPRSR
ncbi:MAG: hypothetical protein QOJ94_1909 [Sphingomonadales bacterium]|jgi:hypothetical protein|nr:hypothetical protein [Sphingomonadales bacterium]